jgi:hypothetical protein
VQRSRSTGPRNRGRGSPSSPGRGACRGRRTGRRGPRSAWGAPWPRRRPRVVEALGEDRHVGEHLGAPLPEGGEGRARVVRLHGAVDDAGAHAEGVERAARFARGCHGDAEGDGAAVPGELLDRAGDEGVALLDVDGLGQLLLASKSAPRAGQRVRSASWRCGSPAAGRGSRRRSSRAACGRRRSLEDLVEALAVAARGGGREAEQRAGPPARSTPSSPEDPPVVLGRGVVALVVDDEPDVAAPEHAAEALLAEGPDRATTTSGRRRGRGGSLARRRRDLARRGRASELLAGLLEQLLPVRQHEHLAPRERASWAKITVFPAPVGRHTSMRRTPRRRARARPRWPRAGKVGGWVPRRSPASRLYSNIPRRRPRRARRRSPGAAAIRATRPGREARERRRPG